MKSHGIALEASNGKILLLIVWGSRSHMELVGHFTQLGYIIVPSLVDNE